MIIKKITHDVTGEFYFDGWMDTQNSAVLAQALIKLEDNVSQLVFDTAKLEYVSSAGIRQIIAAYKQMKGKLTLRNVSSEIMAIFHMKGLDKSMNIEQ